jgi:RNA-binding protein 26
MELKVFSPKRAFSPPDIFGDPKEKEISDDDDDDRNHKHRRRETQSQSSERVTLEQSFTRPYRKVNRPFENGNTSNMEKDASTKFERRRPFNQRGDLGLGRGRGRDSVSWNQRDPRFNSVDISPQMIQQRPNLFMGRGGMPSNAASGSWGAFGLVPRIPSSGLDTLHHSLGFHTSMRPPMNMNPSLSIGIPRQRCRDFEERGFCLRGDMCPMEHGLNRIVIEDVQSLSQFNLPGSLPSAHLIGAHGSLPFPAVSAPSSTLISTKSLHMKNSKNSGVGENGSTSNGPFVTGADLYDPDQPLWSNGRPETSAPPVPLNSTKGEETEQLGADPADDNVDGSSYKPAVRSTIVTLGNESKEDQEPLNNNQEKQTNGNDMGLDFSQNESSRIVRKQSQKAQRTLFVNGVPQKSNKKEILLSHFKRFGQIIDIYIPLNAERAFVQFSKREEAEAALKAPDAVLGNRFIKLWWANRDRITDDGLNTSGTSSRVKDNLQSSSPKAVNPQPNVPKAPPPPPQKKLENLEILKEEIRKKQEMLDQKRNDFKRQLEKLQKHAPGVKGEVASEHPAKRQKAGTIAGMAKASLPSSSDTLTTVTPSVTADVMGDSGKSTDKGVLESSKPNKTMSMKEISSLKKPIHSMASLGEPFVVPKFKLDNRPTAFKIIPPLPTGLADVAILKEHFSAFGDLSAVDIEDAGDNDNSSARVSFTSRRSAELAYINGRIWNSHDLTFVWLPSTNPSKEVSSNEIPSPSSKGSVEGKAVLPRNGESQNLERRQSDEDLQSSLKAASAD